MTMIPSVREAVTWQAINATLTQEFNAKPRRRSGRTRSWSVPSPTGGSLTVEVALNPRWCSIDVDRWGTTDRVDEPASTWLREHVWPHVQDACARSRRFGVLPSGGGSYACAVPVDRTVVLDLLVPWIRQELTWGIPRSAA